MSKDDSDNLLNNLAETVGDVMGVTKTVQWMHSLVRSSKDDLAESQRSKVSVGQVVDVAQTTAAVGAGVTSAGALTVAATSGAGIASGLAGAGSIVGGGMAAGPAVLAAGPVALASIAMDKYVFCDEADDGAAERVANHRARVATRIGGVAGVAGTGVAVVAGGASGAAIMSTLASVGAVVGGGALAGTAMLVVAPVGLAVGAGLLVHKGCTDGWFGKDDEEPETE